MSNQQALELQLTDLEMEELSDFLLSDATSNETMMLDCLDGYLTAIVTAPVMLAPNVWLPLVWGPGEQDEPSFVSDAQMERITALIMRHLSSLMAGLADNPDSCEPVFDSAIYPENPREYIDGEMWAYGFMTAVDLQRKDWQAVFNNAYQSSVLQPIYLLGSQTLTPAQEALIETPLQREELAMLIPASVGGLYRFWTPVRTLNMPAGSFQRDKAKIGRNEKCPCGSGRKYKKCCGITPESVELAEF